MVNEAHGIPDRRSVLEKLLGESAKSHSKIVLIISSQGEDTSDFTPGPHVNRRAPDIIKLLDYTDEELQRILVAMIREKYPGSDKDIEGGFDGPRLQTFVSLIGSGRKSPKFGNVKTLQTCFSKLCNRRAKRLERERRNPDLKEPDHILFTKADMLGEEESEMCSRSTAWKTLQSMIGLKKVKDSVVALFRQAVINHYRELQGKQPIKITLNRCFLGPPGTGKTTVAKLYAQILVDLSFISKSDIVMKAVSDFIGPYLGQSEKRTREALDEARGGVLVIDDAHMLLPGATYDISGQTDIYRAAVIDTLVANLQPEPGDGRAVILIGYTDTMYELFETSNPGLARRFPLEEAFHFTAFNDDQLGQILELKLRRDDLDATPEAKRAAREMLSMARHRPNFGNGGYIENLLSQAKARYQARVWSVNISEGAEQVLKPDDFDPDFARAMEARERCEELFHDMQGVEYIMAQFQGYQDIAARLRMRGHDPRPHIPVTFVFKGPIGTGKTTVARKIGQIFYDMGFLATPELIECSVSDLASGYAGHTGPKVIRMFERALGKVLFIDEAYRLGEMSAVNAIGEIVDCMTKERFARKSIIILAGYQEDMNKLMRLNRGLRSRFATDVIFRPMRPADSLALLGKLVGKLDIQLDGLTPADLSRGPILRILAQLVVTKSWANGRDVEAFSQKVIEYAFKHKATGTDLASKVIVHADELLPLLESRLARAKKEDAETAGNYVPDENADWGPLNNGSKLTHNDDGHEGTKFIKVPHATTSISDMVLLNRDISRSRDF